MVVIEKTNFFTIDTLYNLEINKICFNFNPEIILNELKQLVSENESNKDNKKVSDKNYIIQFHENNDAFIIDISGPLKEEKLKPLKLMFINYLKNKIDRIKVVIYIFSGTDENTMTFSNVWTLLRIWEEIGIKYDKIAYLTSSEIIKNQIDRYFSLFGLRHYENLIELTKAYFPEISKKNEAEIFEFSSKLLETKK